ncbi:hypothetical protein ACPUER_18170 [Burkholderia sp. DN3021]|uniref:hypothetical protein n=1 Tax=Burkholderia sp. DN3021 TaxID=3410137 RepID=UPI003C7E5220
MTEKNRFTGNFALGLLAECSYLLTMIGAALSIAPPADVDMCPSGLTFVLLLLTSVQLYAAVSIGVSIFKRSPAIGVSYFLVLAIVALAVGIAAGFFFFDLTQWWARVIAPRNLFRHRCF